MSSNSGVRSEKAFTRKMLFGLDEIVFNSLVSTAAVTPIEKTSTPGNDCKLAAALATVAEPS